MKHGSTLFVINYIAFCLSVVLLSMFTLIVLGLDLLLGGFTFWGTHVGHNFLQVVMLAPAFLYVSFVLYICIILTFNISMSNLTAIFLVW